MYIYEILARWYFSFLYSKVHKVDIIWNSCRPDQLVEITLHEIDVDCTDGLVMVNSNFSVPSLLTIHLYQSTSTSTIRCSTVGSSTGMCSPAQKITRSRWTRSSNYRLWWCIHPTHGNRVLGIRAIILLMINLIPAIWRVLWQSKAGKSVYVKPGFQYHHKTYIIPFTSKTDVYLKWQIDVVILIQIDFARTPP